MRYRINGAFFILIQAIVFTWQSVVAFANHKRITHLENACKQHTIHNWMCGKIHDRQAAKVSRLPTALHMVVQKSSLA